VSLTISQHIPHTDNWISSLGSLLCALVESLLDRGDILVGNIVSLSLVLELARQISVSSLVIRVNRLDVADNTSVLPSTARLLLV